jgi:(E)-4-hydroxy-3-methylbut-2-enyl-diphosphate synthase
MNTRNKTKTIHVGRVAIGGQTKVVIQSMTNTLTEDVTKTVQQIKDLSILGADLVRVAIPHQKALAALPEIVEKSAVPLVADIHFDYKLAIGAIEAGVAKLRINPGNIGSMEKVKMIINKANEHDVAIRIGVNTGSIGKGRDKVSRSLAAVREYIAFFEEQKFNNIIVSLKSSSVLDTVAMNEQFANEFRYPLHLGVTEAGSGSAAIIKSSIGIGSLLLKGIGDTIRVSVTGDPQVEIPVAKKMLQSIGLLSEGVDLISCPTCGRIDIDLPTLVEQIEIITSTIKEPLTIAVMGCVVNGPGEAEHADYAICGGKGVGLIYKKGKMIKKVPSAKLVAEFKSIIKDNLM